MTPSDKGAILAEALPYLRAFHGKTIVVRFGGQAMADPGLKSGFARDVALLRLVGMKVVVVHGGGWGIDELMRKMGTKCCGIAGIASRTRRRSRWSRWR